MPKETKAQMEARHKKERIELTKTALTERYGRLKAELQLTEMHLKNLIKENA